MLKAARPPARPSVLDSKLPLLHLKLDKSPATLQWLQDQLEALHQQATDTDAGSVSSEFCREFAAQELEGPAPEQSFEDWVDFYEQSTCLEQDEAAAMYEGAGELRLCGVAGPPGGPPRGSPAAAELRRCPPALEDAPKLPPVALVPSTNTSARSSFDTARLPPGLGPDAQPAWPQAEASPFSNAAAVAPLCPSLATTPTAPHPPGDAATPDLDLDAFALALLNEPLDAPLGGDPLGESLEAALPPALSPASSGLKVPPLTLNGLLLSSRRSHGSAAAPKAGARAARRPRSTESASSQPPRASTPAFERAATSPAASAVELSSTNTATTSCTATAAAPGAGGTVAAREVSSRGGLGPTTAAAAAAAAAAGAEELARWPEAAGAAARREASPDRASSGGPLWDEARPGQPCCSSLPAVPAAAAAAAEGEALALARAAAAAAAAAAAGGADAPWGLAVPCAAAGSLGPASMPAQMCPAQAAATPPSSPTARGPGAGRRASSAKGEGMNAGAGPAANPREGLARRKSVRLREETPEGAASPQGEKRRSFSGRVCRPSLRLHPLDA